MTNTKQATGSDPTPHGGTAASAFHLSGTLDWSSLSAQSKNRVTVVPAYEIASPTLEPTSPKSVESASSPVED